MTFTEAAVFVTVCVLAILISQAWAWWVLETITAHVHRRRLARALDRERSRS